MNTQVNHYSDSFSNQNIEALLDQLLLIWKERERVKQKTLTILNWEKWEDCPVDVQELRDGIEWLDSLERFNHTEHMIFRDYVWPHTERVAMMHGRSQYIFQQVYGDTYNHSYGMFYASIHDILEWVSPFWDIITTVKEKFTEESWDIIHTVEWKLAELIMEHFFGSLHPTPQKHIQQAFQDMVKKRTLESKNVSYIDKACEWFMYTFHELVAGNPQFLGNFYRYSKRVRDIKEGKVIPEVQPLFQLSQDEYIEHLGEVHWDDPENMQHFGDVWHLYDIDTFLQQERRIWDFFGKCRPEDVKDHLEDDFWFPAYKVWKEAMLLYNPVTNRRDWIKENGRTLLTVPTKLIQQADWSPA